VFNTKSGKNENEVYLDLTHMPKDTLRKKLAGILEIYEKFVGEDPYENPMRVFPAVHYSMGGLWIDFDRSASGSLTAGSPKNHATNIEGLYAAGEVDYQYHGANRLGANSLLSCIYAGLVTGPAMASYRQGLDKSSFEIGSLLFEKAEKREQKKWERITGLDGDENAFRIHQELGEAMLMDVTIERDNDKLDKVLEKIETLTERSKKVGVLDPSTRANDNARFIRHLDNMLVLARVIAQGARNRDESRGAHFKPAFKERNDPQFLRSTLAFHQDGGKNAPSINYVREFDYTLLGKAQHITDAVDISLVRPRARKYETAGAASAVAQETAAEEKKKAESRAPAE
jgi:succinate dehydrogenase / fumarate reductase flavoprotein subunit